MIAMQNKNGLPRSQNKAKAAEITAKKLQMKSATFSVLLPFLSN
jgi:hypothetical protein